MNREKYLEQLAQRNSYCRCNELTDLFEKRKIARNLEAKCDSFKDNADLQNPQPGNEQFLKDYKKEAQGLRDAIQNYEFLLYIKADQGKVYFALHDPEQQSVKKILSLEELKKRSIEDNPIISIHCNRCEQQIDLFSELLKIPS